MRLPADAARMLGVDKHPYMMLDRSTYGKVDVPRGWFRESCRGMQLAFTRVARPSLNAETQAAAEATDSLEYAKTFWNLLHQREQPVLSPSLRTTGLSALASDAKSMYDAAAKDTAIKSATHKHAAAELLVFKQILRQTGCILRWASSERQLADGLTQVSARQLFAERLVRQACKLVYDPSFTAAKKKNRRP